MPENSRGDQVREVLAELLGEPLDDPGHVNMAGRLVADRYKVTHRRLHADAQRGGALVWLMRERGMSWREIYDATGIVQRTADRWRDLFLEEGITPQPDGELDARLQGEDSKE